MVGWGGGAGAPVWADGAEVTHVGGRGCLGKFFLTSERGACHLLRARMGRCYGLEAERRCEVIG